MEREKLVKRLKEICDFILDYQKEDGQIDLEEAHFIYPTGYNMRAMAAAYKITRKEKYLNGILKWLDLVFSQQNKDGSFWASTTQLENSYGRFVSDTANGLNVVYNILPYLDEGRKEKYLSGLKKFVNWIIKGEEGRSFILENGACGCGIYKDDKERGRPECLECTAIALCTSLTPYYRITKNTQYLQIATRAVKYILSRQENNGIYPYISKGMNVQAEGDRIIHILHYVLEGLVYYYEHSGIEFFDPLAVEIRQSIKKSCRWLVENQEENGRWGKASSGNDAAKFGGLLLPLNWYLKMAPQEESYKEYAEKVKLSVEKAAKFLLSEEAITEYGILRLIRQNGFGGMALAEIIQPGITIEIGSSEKIEEVAEIKELFPMEILKMLPEAESSFPGMNGWIHQGEKTQVVFWYSKEGCICKEHSHPYPEWGIVVSGYTEVTIEGEKRIYHKGDSFFIPANARHSSKMSKNYRAIDIFASPSHIKVKKGGGV